MEFIDWYFRILLVLLAVLLAQYLRGREKQGVEQVIQLRKEEKEDEKKELIASLLSEIEHNEAQLNFGFERRTMGFPHKAFWRMLSTDNFNSAKSSERYLSLPQSAQRILSDYYKDVEHMITLVNRLDGEENARRISKVYVEQARLLGDLIKITKDLKIVLEDAKI